MAYKSSGTAAKSASGASMSKFDVEIDARVSALEKAVKELQSHTHDSGGLDSDSKQRLDDVERLIRDSGLV